MSGPDRRDAVIAALAAWHVEQTIGLERQLEGWKTVCAAALQALDTQVAEARRLREVAERFLEERTHAN